MDNLVIIMFGCVIATLTALNFMELRKIRKRLEGNGEGQELRKAPDAMVFPGAKSARA